MNLFEDKDYNESPEDKNYGSIVYRDDIKSILNRLSESKFRNRFHLTDSDRRYITAHGLSDIRRHAEKFILQRLAPASIINDGKQTPWKGHPVFISQHATGCCCRKCLSKWHDIPPGIRLSREQRDYMADVIMAWIERELQ